MLKANLSAQPVATGSPPAGSPPAAPVEVPFAEKTLEGQVIDIVALATLDIEDYSGQKDLWEEAYTVATGSVLQTGLSQNLLFLAIIQDPMSIWNFPPPGRAAEALAAWQAYMGWLEARIPVLGLYPHLFSGYGEWWNNYRQVPDHNDINIQGIPG